MNYLRLLTDAQLKAELEKCEFCEEQPCTEACPANCSPADFIMAVKVGEPQDYRRSAAEIMFNNPLGGVCGMVCPDQHCMAACVHNGFDGPVQIPSVQATIVDKARKLGAMPEAEPVPADKPHGVAVVGGGPAGLAAAAFLRRSGYPVTIFERSSELGGAMRLIPRHRLPKDMIDADIQWLLDLGDMDVRLETPVDDPKALLDQGYAAVVVAAGLTEAMRPGIPGDDAAILGLEFLADPSSYGISGPVAIIGGGATAVDCAVTALDAGASRVEMLALERWDEAPLTADERREILERGVDFTGRTRVIEVKRREGGLELTVEKIRVNADRFRFDSIEAIPGTKATRPDFEHLIVAIGARPGLSKEEHEALFYAGDFFTGPSTVVQAVASGKNAAREVMAFLEGQEAPTFAKHDKSYDPVPGFEELPVPIEAEFFGRKIPSPFLLSAAPPSDGYEQMRRAYEAGWAGGVMKTAFDGVPIHIPGEYMHQFDDETYGNFDNVSGHPLDRVCEEVSRLVAEFPDRLTLASTGGPVTGDDEADKAAWQSNTKKLEQAGVMGIEYSLSCPQGGDGTEGDIVSQSPSVTAKIVDWIMEVSDPEIPKLFKLTGAVTSIAVIVNAVKEVLDRYPHKKAGVTLANTFPTMIFRKGEKEEWEEGIIVGMSGAGIAPISNLTLANVGNLGVKVSGNGGPMDYKAAAHFLALGAETVQFCTIVMKYGYGIVRHLHSGLSHLMAERGISSVSELIGRALPNPIRDFMDTSPVKKISQVDPELCQRCGNCARCPYLAIELDEDKIPHTDPSKCIGCSICVQKCFAGALYMRDRTPEEAAALKEA